MAATSNATSLLDIVDRTRALVSRNITVFQIFILLADLCARCSVDAHIEALTNGRWRTNWPSSCWVLEQLRSQVPSLLGRPWLQFPA